MILEDVHFWQDRERNDDKCLYALNARLNADSLSMQSPPCCHQAFAPCFCQGQSNFHVLCHGAIEQATDHALHMLKEPHTLIHNLMLKLLFASYLTRRSVLHRT